MTKVQAFFDPATFTVSYLVFDHESKDAVVIDPVLDYDPLASQTSTASADKITHFVKENALNVKWILETHAHADHLSSAQLLKERFGAGVAIGKKITVVQETFKKVFNLPEDFPTDGSQFDRLLADGETLEAGSLRIEVIGTPGHTPACLSFKVEDMLFCGDTIFMDDYGTGRCDFPAGSADDLYNSVHEKLYKLPDHTRVFVGHDYQPGGREVAWETTIGKAKQGNVHLRDDTSKQDYVALRTGRDATLNPPRLIFQSVQVNVNAGQLPLEQEGVRYLVLPLNLFGKSDDLGVPKS